MPKAGKQFELVVTDVVKELDPSAIVEQGKWVEGPDGRRDMDVLVKGTVNGVPRRVLIECKDYNPAGRPIGIGIVDAFESKSCDLGVDVSLLCSNAGFARDAIHKAGRVGIGLIGVLREADPRIRYHVVDEVYIRRFDFLPRENNIKIHWQGAMEPQGDLKLEQILYDGFPVSNWLTNRAVIYVANNPVVNGVHSLNFRFKDPVTFSLPSRVASATGLVVLFEIKGGWFAQQIKIDATSGLYDWIRRTIRIGPGEGRITYRDVKFGEGGTSIKCPPELECSIPRDLSEGEVTIWIVDMDRINIPEAKYIPDLDRFVMDEDLEPVRHDLPAGSWHS